MTRHRYRLNPLHKDQSLHAPLPPDFLIRGPRPDDTGELAALMLDAYQGSVDDDGETIEDALKEVESYFAKKSGKLLLDFSYVCLIDGEIQSAVLLSLWQKTPLLAYVMTRSDWKGRGLAGRLLRLALAGLSNAGFRSAEAYVTEGNIPSERLLASLGFLRVADR